MKGNFQEMDYDGLLEKFKTIIKKSGLKYTAQRESILSTMYEHPQHLTTDELFSLVKKKYPKLNIGIATIYRTLILLEENELVSSISLGTQGKKFELVNKPHHDHLICIECGTIVEFENNQIETIQCQIAQENGFELTDHLMQLYGVCSVCKDK